MSYDSLQTSCGYECIVSVWDWLIMIRPQIAEWVIMTFLAHQHQRKSSKVYVFGLIPIPISTYVSGLSERGQMDATRD